MSGIFLKCQAEFLESMMTEPVTLEEKSRRTGFSWTASFGADLTAASAKNAGGMDVFYLGYNLEMAREFIDYCAEHAAVMEQAASEVHESFWHDPDHPEKDTKVFRIDFASGFKILALPSRPRALRGMQGLVIIDEAAFHDDLEELLKAAIALLMWGGRVVIISTHDGDTNPFNVLVQSVLAGKKPYKLLRTTLDDALNDGLYKKMCARKGEVWSQEVQDKWRDDLIAFYGAAADEELFCIPNPSTGAYIPLALIDARSEKGVPVKRWACDAAFTLMADRLREIEARAFCEDQLAPVLDALDPKASHVFGEDFGRSGDLTVIWVLQIRPNTDRATVLVVELRNTPFEQQKQILHYVLDRLPRFRAGKMDGRGNGQYLAEVTVQRYGSRVEAVMLTEGWYRDEMPPMKAAFEDATLTLPADQEIHDDIRALKLVRGVARVPDQRSEGGTGKRHGDAAIALAMAYAASRSDPEEYHFELIKSPREIEDSRRPDGRSSIEQEIAREQLGRGDGNMGFRGMVL
ncbi:Mu-like prophage FluMu protein gp28 [Gluconobacter thailandicus F149-1 = NBRC 100600]|uniref:Mu-like prophage FluMu protein gp28 n=1 Tax=Gluconobacter thailandicus NBRC 3257 TaxID=1381097 RepID=A0ABQ0IW69_GLUTH|nr:Mu-like prophage FluMu protein gp28 [Gluconobacter thailandicus]KXV54160.1 hypothetical protein AD946_04300 [Gluconobacter thailandicus]GAD26449.1 Mu-like prophage FluMu protein gp28 [Gluconobacter thailandicus NBRC 3257]GAN92986.1 Mu-like prophage FluMu protein gp28 [Gluconobacter thailandicus F149-1 = NBRC 100600]GBR61598.1 Mu-like prophage FluMu protein gp28 [Gluconobacter thailandicus F149-1 = NBRC 100600]GEL87465.1 hypothetical protein GTH01_18230 [Gluconobacter thailandicus F149-1 = N